MSILHDPWELCDALQYKGGSQNFSAIHFEMMEELCSPQLEDYYYASKYMKVSRGHLKSTLLVLYILWRIYRNPNIRILYSTNTKDLSRMFIREVRQYLESVELQESVWNVREHISGNLVPSLDAASRRKRNISREDTEAEDKKIIWSREAIQVLRPKKLKEPTLVAGSVLSTNTGEHYDLIINDDAVDFQNSDNEEKADKIKDWAMDAFSVLDPPSYDQVTPTFGEWVGNSMYVIGTPYYPWDYYSYIEANAQTLKFCTFEANVYLNGVDNSDGYTYPEKFNDAYIESLMGRMSRKKFFAQYLLKHISDEDVILDEGAVSWIAPPQICFTKDGYAVINVGGGVQKRIRLHLVVDPASGKQVGRVDKTAIGVGGQDELLNMYVVYLQSKKTLTSETIDTIYKLATDYGITVVNILVRGVGELLPHAIQRERTTYNKVLVTKTVSETGNKKVRITNALQPLIKTNKLFVVSWVQINTPFVKELRQHPEGNEDNCLDVVSAIVQLSQPTRQKVNKRGEVRCTHLTVNRKYGGSL